MKAGRSRARADKLTGNEGWRAREGRGGWVDQGWGACAVASFCMNHRSACWGARASQTRELPPFVASTAFIAGYNA